tara:strand:- start:4171 stop:4542 length:372 start_codon:yes stop_codon:yes gene_type:complete
VNLNKNTKTMTHDLADTYDVDKREMLVETENVRVHTLHLTEGQIIPWHKHTEVDDTFVCLTGETIILSDGKQKNIKLSPGERCTIYCGVGHAVKPKSKKGTSFLLIQATGKHDFIPLPIRSII